MAMRTAQNVRRPVEANRLKLADIWGAGIGLPVVANLYATCSKGKAAKPGKGLTAIAVKLNKI
jgi:hypothetical protein